MKTALKVLFWLLVVAFVFGFVQLFLYQVPQWDKEETRQGCEQVQHLANADAYWSTQYDCIIFKNGKAEEIKL